MSLEWLLFWRGLLISSVSWSNLLSLTEGSWDIDSAEEDRRVGDGSAESGRWVRDSGARGGGWVRDGGAGEGWWVGDGSTGGGRRVGDGMKRTVRVAELVCLPVERVDGEFDKYKSRQCRHTHQVHHTSHNHFPHLSFLISHYASFVLAFSTFGIAPHKDL